MGGERNDHMNKDTELGIIKWKQIDAWTNRATGGKDKMEATHI